MSKQWVEVSGKIIELGEGEQHVMHLYYTIRNFYPIIRYEYIIDGHVFVGACGRESLRRYRVSEIDQWGNKRNDREYFWRELSVGDIVPIQVDCSNPSNSRLAISATQTYYSERKALVAGFLLIAIAISAVLWLLTM